MAILGRLAVLTSRCWALGGRGKFGKAGSVDVSVLGVGRRWQFWEGWQCFLWLLGHPVVLVLPTPRESVPFERAAGMENRGRMMVLFIVDRRSSARTGLGSPLFCRPLENRVHLKASLEWKIVGEFWCCLWFYVVDRTSVARMIIGPQ